MPIYVYETIPSKKSEEPVQFEVWQEMSEEPLATHPETGQPVQRVLSGGLNIISKSSSSGGGGCCGGGGCGC